MLGAIAMVVGIVQVVGRYFFPALAISWAEEVIVYLVVWGVMIISSQLVRTDGHVRPDLVLRLVPPGGQRWLEAFNCVVALVFCGGMVWYGWEIVDTSLLLDERSSSGLQFPMWIYYSALPAGGVLMTVRYLIRLYRYLFASIRRPCPSGITSRLMNCRSISSEPGRSLNRCGRSFSW